MLQIYAQKTTANYNFNTYNFSNSDPGFVCRMNKKVVYAVGGALFGLTVFIFAVFIVSYNGNNEEKNYQSYQEKSDHSPLEDTPLPPLLAVGRPEDPLKPNSGPYNAVDIDRMESLHINSIAAERELHEGPIVALEAKTSKEPKNNSFISHSEIKNEVHIKSLHDSKSEGVEQALYGKETDYSLLLHHDVAAPESLYGLDPAFRKAHEKFLQTLSAFFKDEADESALNNAFLEAKNLSPKVTNPNAKFIELYSKTNGKDGGCTALVRLNSNMIIQSLKSMEPLLTNTSISRLYEVLRLNGKLGRPSTLPFTFRNYPQEAVAFFSILYNKYQGPIDEALGKMILSNEIPVHKIVIWWKEYGLTPSTGKVPSNIDHYTAREIKNEPMALKFAASPYLDSCIDQFISGKNIKEAEESYTKIVLCGFPEFPATLQELVDTYIRPRPVIPFRNAVLSTSPRILEFKSTCYANSYFQCMANFLPLFRQFPGWNHPQNSDLTKKHQEIFEQVAKPESSPFDATKVIELKVMDKKLSQATSQAIIFSSGFALENLASANIKGFAMHHNNKNYYFPMNRIFHFTPGFPELPCHVMTGQLLIAAISRGELENDQNKFDPIELPLSINIKVAGEQSSKKYELAAFTIIIGMGTPHGVAYVKRADGQWWLCNDLSFQGNTRVPDDQLPNTVEIQSKMSIKQRPHIAFYIRTEQ